MKGWHRHGVCDERHWPYLDNEGGVGKPETDWETDAATRPLGAYYRVDKDSIVDMQAAIVEVGAIYVSATVHKGWFPAQWERSPDGIAIITVGDPSAVGGHAFALVGYTAAGFIVQNSWGPSWGSDGFAILTYDDWIERGVDAWVAVLGAPTLSGRERKPTVIEITRGSPTAAFWSVGRSPETSRKYPGYEPWDERSAYLKSIVMGNNGIVLNRIPEAENALASLERVVAEEPAKWLDPGQGRTKIVLYAHGFEVRSPGWRGEAHPAGPPPRW